MKTLFKRTFHLPGSSWFHRKIHSLSLTGKIIFGFLVFLFGLGAFGLLWNVSNAFLVAIPKPGGTFTEGVIGVPRFINPILAITEGDKDIAALVYSGLIRRTSDGKLIPDLADHYTISPDGKTYDIILRSNAFFQDGTTVTADDVVFTVEKVQDPQVKSPKQQMWAGVTVQKVSSNEVKFILAEPYAPFLDNLTLGIVPKHAIKDPSGDLSNENININPLGSGPYRLKNLHEVGDKIPSSYELTAYSKFTLGQPFITTIIIRFYATEKDLVTAYTNGDIDNMNSISPRTALELHARTEQASLSRIFGVFFNQSNNDALNQPEVRQALAMSVDRGYIVNTVLGGYGTPLESAVPASFVSDDQSAQVSWAESHVDQANTLLNANGWKLNQDGIREKKTKKGTTTLSFSISTSDAPELGAVATILKNEWQAIGATVTIKVFEGGYLNQNVIRPRKYDALLFGQVVNPDLDLYAFWHSSEISDPGLNVALYSNPTADKLLENMRVTLDPELRKAEYAKFDSELRKDMPAIFLYSPNFIYVVTPNIKKVSIANITTPSDRFGSVYTWYIDTDNIWKIFTH